MSLCKTFSSFWMLCVVASIRTQWFCVFSSCLLIKVAVRSPHFQWVYCLRRPRPKFKPFNEIKSKNSLTLFSFLDLFKYLWYRLKFNKKAIRIVKQLIYCSLNCMFWINQRDEPVAFLTHLNHQYLNCYFSQLDHYQCQCPWFSMTQLSHPEVLQKAQPSNSS